MTSTKSKQFNLPKYVTGRLYAQFLVENQQNTFTIKDTKTRSWYGVLSWLKTKEYIVDFKFGKELDTYCFLTITVNKQEFTPDKLAYGYYLKAIENNMKRDNVISDDKSGSIAEERHQQPDDFVEATKTERVERVQREDSSTVELNKEIRKDLAKV